MSSKLHMTFAVVLVSTAMAVGQGVASAATNAAANTTAQATSPIIPGLGNTSTPNRVANRNRATRARVERREEQITRDLNKASASGQIAQATLPQTGATTINETGAPVAVPTTPVPAAPAPAVEPAPLPPAPAASEPTPAPAPPEAVPPAPIPSPEIPAAPPPATP